MLYYRTDRNYRLDDLCKRDMSRPMTPEEERRYDSLRESYLQTYIKRMAKIDNDRWGL